MRERDANCIEIGLVNNMPDAALEATEAQFRELLDTASQDIGAEGVHVHLSLYALPGVPRTAASKHRMSATYENASELWNRQLDGLIVTGAEPQAKNLADEPYWNDLAQLVDWAEHNTQSSVWSCLAAHAAVRQLDGMNRQPLGEKLFGVFECASVSDSPLMAGIAPRFQMPHSRWNGLPEAALEASGYRTLAQSPNAASIGAFIKQRKSLFLFFQGHPEYDAQSLLGEYRRDIRRFLRAERETYPAMPQGYFNDEAAEALAALRERALADRRLKTLSGFPAAALAAQVKNTWRPAAVGMYRNWLRYLAAQKGKRLKVRPRVETSARPTPEPLVENALEKRGRSADQSL